MPNEEQSLQLVVVLSFVNIWARSESVWNVMLLAMLVSFPEIWWMVLLEWLYTSLYQHLGLFPIRTLTLDIWLIVCWCVHAHKHELLLPDGIKLAAFVLEWALLLVYAKNRLLLFRQTLIQKEPATGCS
jgi:hypothetical protein